MSILNFNSNTPAPPFGMTNILFQSDTSGNISAYDAGQAWQTWTPTVMPQGGMTMTAITLQAGRYLRMGSLIFFQFAVNGTLGGTITSSIWFGIPPIAPVSSSQGINQIAVAQSFQGNYGATVATIMPTEIRVSTATAGTFLAGTANFDVCGFYSCV